MTDFTYEQAIESSTKYFNGDSLAAKVFVDKYSLKDNDGKIYEDNPEKMHRRLAKEFARIEKNKFKNPLTEDEIFGYFDRFKYIIPQGSPMSTIGNNYQIQSLGNCFVIPNVVDSYGGICYADQQLAQLMKRRAGVGTCLDNIRPKGLVTRNAAKTTDGIGVFMERFSNTCREVAQGGRRGALMLLVSVHYPEIETFINIKKDLKKVTGANISVKLTDEFMNAVKNDTDYEQRWPINSENPQIVKKVNARKIWNQIIDAAWESAEPGILFFDNIKKYGTSDIYKTVDKRFEDIATNPCHSKDNLLLTQNGYISFGDLYQSQCKNTVITDNRIEYIDNCESEKLSNWIINSNKFGTSQKSASEVFLTQKNAKIIQLSFDNGAILKVTPNHAIATSSGMIEASNLTENHDILCPCVDSDINIFNTDPKTIDEMCSLIMGLVAGDGTFSKNSIFIDFWGNDSKRAADKICEFINFIYSKDYSFINFENGWDKRKMSPFNIIKDLKNNKIRIKSTWLKKYLDIKYTFNKETKCKLPKFVLNNSRTNIGAYYLSGILYSDGTIGGNKKSGFSVRINQSNDIFLKELQLLCHSLGVNTKLYLRRKSSLRIIKGKNVLCKNNYDIITINNTWKNLIKIGFFGHPQKEARLKNNFDLYKINNKFFTKLISSVDIPNEDVFCIQEKITRSIIVNSIANRRCGEIPMGVDSCRLMVVNLYSYVKNPFTKSSEFLYDLFYEHTKIAQRLMDDMIDLEIEAIDKIIEKINKDPEDEHIKRTELETWQSFRETCIAGRRTGLGITALGDTLASLGIKYGSDKSIEISEEIYKQLCLASMESSCEMAKEIGAFPIWDKDIEKDHPFLNRIFDASPKIKKLHSQYGRRNISLTTTAPTGTVSICTQTTSGIEPPYLLSYIRRRKVNPDSKNIKVDFIDSLGDKWEENTVYHHHLKTWMDVTGETDIEKSPYFGATSNDVNWIKSVEIQAAAQKWITHSISKTCNVPNSATKELISEIYLKAWETGCKGFTVYRDGCRSGVLVAEPTKTNPNKIIHTKAPKRPESLNCDIHHLNLNDKRYYAVIGLLENDPYEVFVGLNTDDEKDPIVPKSIKSGKLIKKARQKYVLTNEDKEFSVIISNGHTDENADALGRLLSTALRHGTPIDFIVHQLEKTHGSLTSFSKIMSRVLKKYIKDGSVVHGENCKECGSQLQRSDGCVNCKNCGWTKCS